MTGFAAPFPRVISTHTGNPVKDIRTGRRRPTGLQVKPAMTARACLSDLLSGLLSGLFVSVRQLH
ncbi:hypothetical protein [Candidatus Spongiihabitans sp.]|uniref:hypothetical protein n=1 Tax=Candidatus Spongiihabitans sp. TaxID=3101308 RepID=UPI003C7D0762